MTKSMQFEISDKEWAALRRKASERGLKVQALLRLLVQEYNAGTIGVEVSLKHFDLGGVTE